MFFPLTRNTNKYNIDAGMCGLQASRTSMLPSKKALPSCYLHCCRTHWHSLCKQNACVLLAWFYSGSRLRSQIQML